MKISKWAVFFIVLMAAVSMLTPLTGDRIKTITESISNGDITSAMSSLTDLIIISILIAVMNSVSEFGLLSATRSQINSDRLDLLRKSVEMTYESIERLKSSKIRNVINDSISEVSNSVTSIARNGSSILMMVATVSYVTYLNWKLGVTLIGTYLLSVCATKIYSSFTAKNMEVKSKLRDEKSGMYNSMYLGFYQWFSNRSLHSVRNRLEKTLNDLNTVFRKEIRYDSLIDFVLNGLIDMGQVISIYIIIIASATQVTEVGLLPMIISFTGVLSYGIHSTARLGKNVASYKTHRNRIREIHDEVSIKYGNMTLDKSDNYRIEFDINSFRYPMNPEVEVLKDLKMDIDGYGMYSIVSASGTGKSTLLRLLTRLYDGYQGSIRINNVDVKNLTEESLHENIYMISQSPYFCDLSIRDNFLLECPEASDERILEACRKFSIIEDLLISNQGLDTILGESGLNLSGGQKQLLSMAKLLIRAKSCKILILDEATSALDGVNQDTVLGILTELAKDHIILMVNHRMSMNTTSMIYFIDGDKKLHVGRHQELLESVNEYKELYSKELR